MHQHAHQHGHAHVPPESAGDMPLIIAVGVNVLLTIAQVAAGLIAGSLALVADALHNLSDAAALGLALIARTIARRPADLQRTFGYRRAEVIGALINLTVLIVLGLYLIYEAIHRFFAPEPVQGWIVIIVASIALIVDVITAVLLFAGSRTSINIRAAFIHNIADALGSLAVIVAGTLILLYNFHLADTLATLAIAGYILYIGITTIRQSIRILMQSVPPDIAIEQVIRELESLDHVCGVHHVHAWQLDEHHRALEAHIVIDIADATAMEQIKRTIKQHLRDSFQVDHSTLEFEFAHEACKRTER